ncbi:MAG: hypothetical protein AAF460_07260, partial [Pseudomonadota bacterium]
TAWVLFACAGMSACVNTSPSTDVESEPVTVEGATANTQTGVVVREAGEGEDYDWENDHTGLRIRSRAFHGHRLTLHVG